MILNDLEAFVDRVNDFYLLPSSKQIDYFVYFCIVVSNNPLVKVNDIKEYFDVLHLKAYSNISSYLSSNSKGKEAKFIKTKGGYDLVRNLRIAIDSELGTVKLPNPSDNLFSLDLVKGTRGYIEKVASQACLSYDFGLYDACLVMIRKMMETLIIEAFERYEISDKIKGNDNNFYYLSDLIPALINETKWNISRNATQSIPKIKTFGDLSAHNRRFIAKKSDIDKIKDDLF